LTTSDRNIIHDINFAAGNSLIIEKIIVSKDIPENESRGSNKFVPKYFMWRFVDFLKEEIILEIDNKNRKNNYTAEQEEDDS